MMMIENLLAGSSEAPIPDCKRLLREARKHVGIKKANGLFQIMSYQCGICGDLTFQLKSRYITHLREQHSEVAYKCNKCLKIFRWNDNPHNCRTQKEDFYLFSHSTGLKREESEAEVRSFMKNAIEKIIKEITSHKSQLTTNMKEKEHYLCLFLRERSETTVFRPLENPYLPCPHNLFKFIARQLDFLL